MRERPPDALRLAMRELVGGEVSDQQIGRFAGGDRARDEAVTVGPGQLDRVVAGKCASAGVQQRSATGEVGDHPADNARPRVVENPHALLGQRKHHVPARAEGERVGKVLRG